MHISEMSRNWKGLKKYDPHLKSKNNGGLNSKTLSYSSSHQAGSKFLIKGVLH